jgi:hypothetical protein
MYRVVVYIVLSLPPPSNPAQEAKLMSDQDQVLFCFPANHATRLKRCGCTRMRAGCPSYVHPIGSCTGFDLHTHRFMALRLLGRHRFVTHSGRGRGGTA